LKLLIGFFLALVPVSLITGINFDISNIVGIKVSVGYTDIIIVIFLILLVFSKPKIQVPSKIFFSYLLTLFFIILSFVNLSFKISNTSILELIKWIEYFLLFVIIYSFSTLDNLKISFVFLFLSSIIFIIVAIYQAFTFNYYEKRIYGTFVSSADIASESISNPNVAGAFIAGCFLFFYSLRLYYNGFKKKVFYVLQVVCLILVVATLSRSALLGLIIGVLISRKLYKKSLMKNLIFLIFIFLFFLVLYSNSFLSDYSDFVIIDRFISTFDSTSISGSSVTGRIENSSKILGVAFENLFLGIGFGDLENQYKLIPDNYYVHTFAEVGIFGLLSFLSLSLLIIFDLFSFVKNRDRSDFLFFFGVIVLSINISFLFENYAANLFRNPRLLGLYWYILALVYKYNFLIGLNKFEKK
jgi:hypothetical protein